MFNTAFGWINMSSSNLQRLSLGKRPSDCAYSILILSSLFEKKNLCSSNRILHCDELYTLYVILRFYFFRQEECIMITEKVNPHKIWIWRGLKESSPFIISCQWQIKDNARNESCIKCNHNNIGDVFNLCWNPRVYNLYQNISRITHVLKREAPKRCVS